MEGATTTGVTMEGTTTTGATTGRRRIAPKKNFEDSLALFNRVRAWKTVDGGRFDSGAFSDGERRHREE
jgi:hypothetical protein